jgi:hypothetical protein
MEATASHSWITLNGQSGVPQYFTMTPGPMSWPVTLGVNGTGMQPDVYVGAVTWTSLDSGQPPFEPQREVRMDLCRQVTALPPTVVYVAPSTTEDVPLLVSTVPGATVRDLDVGLGVMVKGGGGELRGVYATVVEPGSSAQTALLGENLFSVNTIYDEDTNSRPGAAIDVLPAPGLRHMAAALEPRRHADPRGDDRPLRDPPPRRPVEPVRLNREEWRQ